MKTKGLTAKVEKDGSVSFTDSKGKEHSRLAPPRAWDAAVDAKSGLPAAETPARLDVVQQGKGKATVTVSVDAAWANNPARAFPVTLDPTYAAGANISPSFDTRVQTDGGTLDYSADTELRVGTFNGGSVVARSFIMFPTTAVQGKQVTSASLSLYENWSYSCTASPMTLSTAGAVSAATRWNNQPTISSVFTTASFAKGASSSCPAGRVSLNMLPLVQSAQSNNWTQMSVALRAASETDSNGWKRFGSSESANPPYVTWTYNRAPNTAAAPTFLASGTYGSVGYVRGGRVTFTTKATDADASGVKALIEVHNSTTVTGTSKVASCTTPLGASGAEIKCVNDVDMPDGGTFYVRALVTDELGLSAGSWSGWTTIKRAGTAPAAPSVSCPGYANGSWTSSGPSADVTCTISTTGSGVLAPVRLEVYVDGATSPAKTVDVKQAPATTTVVIPKTAQGGHSVRAVAVGGASLSATTMHELGWGAASLMTPVKGTATSGKIQVTGNGPATNVQTNAKLQWRVAGTSTWVVTATPQVTISGSAASASAVFDAPAVEDGPDNQPLPTRVPVTFEVRVCFSYTTGNDQCTDAVTPSTVTRVPHAFGGGYPTKEAGPGQVAQYTGEFQMSEDDVTVPGAAELSVSRSHLSMVGGGTIDGWVPDGLAGSVFGPGWTADLGGADSGMASRQLIDNTGLDGTFLLSDADGSVLVFRHKDNTAVPEKTGLYLPITQESIDSGLKVELVSGKVVVTESDKTTTTFVKTANRTSTAAAQWFPSAVSRPGGAGSTTYVRDGSTGLPTRVVTGLPTGSTATDCAATEAGCRALNFEYGTANTGGDRIGQIKKITAKVWNPATSQHETAVMATYGYDDKGRLVRATDARTGLATTYTWAAGSVDTTRLASIKPAGLAAYRLAYDPTTGRLATIDRDAADGGTSTVRLSTFFYNVPLSSSPVNIASIATPKWKQASLPTGGFFAVVGQGRAPASGPSIPAADLPYATLSYVDALGYEVNTAAYGAGQWLLTATDYNADGQVIRSFDTSATTALQQLSGTVDPEVANNYSTQTIYNTEVRDSGGAVQLAAGTLVTDVITPGTTVTMPDGTLLTGARRTIHTDYDQGAPNGGINPATSARYNLATSVKTTVTGSSIVLSTSTNSYAKIVSTDGDPWALGSASRVTTDGVVKTVRRDVAGRVIETRDPSAANTSASPQATQTIYYTTGANAADGSCGGTSQSAAWVDQICVIKSGAAPSAGPVLPTKRFTYDTWLNTATVTETAGSANRVTTTKYNTQGRLEWSGITATTGQARSATFTKYNAATGLMDYTGVSNAAGTDATTARVTTTYDAWGRKTKYTNDQGEATTTSYDSSGRVQTVSDPTGSSTYGYDGTDANGKTERRGLPTSLTVTRAGSGGSLSYKGAYDVTGNLVRQDLPGKITQTITTNELNDPTGLAYAGQVTPTTATTNPATGEMTWTPGTPTIDTWLAWTMDRDGLGRIIREYTGNGAGFDGNPGIPETGDTSHLPVGQGFAYDRQYTYTARGQLSKVIDRTAAAPVGAITPNTTAADTPGLFCQIRTYGFNTDGARTSWTMENHDNGECTSTANATVNIGYTYDSANRLTTGATINGTSTGAYVYDALGRQTTIPASDTPNLGAAINLGYYVDDLPASITQAGVTTAFSLDSQARRSTQTTTGGANNGQTVVRHYGDESDNPAWSVTTPAGGGAAQLTRYTGSLGSGLGAMITSTGDASIALLDPQANNVTTITIPATTSNSTAATTINGWANYVEYGVPAYGTAQHNPGITGPLGYGWLGSEQRSMTSDTVGLTLMGVRFYSWTTGSFTSPDPVRGGNDTSYAYPTDPLSSTDVTGMLAFRWSAHWWGLRARIYLSKWETFLFATGLGTIREKVNLVLKLIPGIIGRLVRIYMAILYWYTVYVAASAVYHGQGMKLTFEYHHWSPGSRFVYYPERL